MPGTGTVLLTAAAGVALDPERRVRWNAFHRRK